MIRNKLGNFIVAVCSAVAIFGSVLPAVMASSRESYSYIFNFGGSSWITLKEEYKANDSCVYMDCNYSESTDDYFDAYVWGWDSSNNIDYNAGGPWAPYTFWEGSTHYMYNYVHENDCDYAYIKAYHAGDGEGYFRGKWMPDTE
ncbi:MAG: hypothetical protein ACI4D0_11225 [Lachnospira sp.]